MTEHKDVAPNEETGGKRWRRAGVLISALTAPAWALASENAVAQPPAPEMELEAAPLQGKTSPEQEGGDGDIPEDGYENSDAPPPPPPESTPAEQMLRPGFLYNDGHADKFEGKAPPPDS